MLNGFCKGKKQKTVNKNCTIVGKFVPHGDLGSNSATTCVLGLGNTEIVDTGRQVSHC